MHHATCWIGNYEELVELLIKQELNASSSLINAFYIKKVFFYHFLLINWIGSWWSMCIVISRWLLTCREDPDTRLPILQWYKFQYDHQQLNKAKKHHKHIEYLTFWLTPNTHAILGCKGIILKIRGAPFIQKRTVGTNQTSVYSSLTRLKDGPTCIETPTERSGLKGLENCRIFSTFMEIHQLRSK